MRVLEERTDIAYSKVFFKTSGFITREWYPYFYAVRRNGESFEEVYRDAIAMYEAMGMTPQRYVYEKKL